MTLKVANFPLGAVDKLPGIETLGWFLLIQWRAAEHAKGAKDFMAAEEENASVPEPKKRSSIVRLIILLVILGVLGGGGYFAYLKYFHHPTDQAKEEKIAEKVIYEMDTFLVNLADAGGRRYLKVAMKFELNNPQVLEEVQNKVFEIRDAMLMVLSSKEFEDISSPAGKLSLKQELMITANKLLRRGQIKEIFFTDFIVQ